jgi:hypothetical protein
MATVVQSLGGQVPVVAERQERAEPDAVAGSQLQAQGPILATQGVQREVANTVIVKEPTIAEFMKLDPPQFKGEVGEDPERYIEEVSRICEVLECSAEKTLKFASFRLKGIAYDWYDAFIKGRPVDAPNMTWPDFKRELVERFLPRNERQARAKKLEQLKQENRTVAQYLQEFTRLSRYAPHLIPTEEERVQRFIDGLKPELRSVIVVGTYRSLNEVENAARNLERCLREVGSDRAQHKRPRFESQMSNVRGRTAQGYQQRQYQDQRLTQTIPYCQTCMTRHFGGCPVGQGRCFNCGLSDHLKRNCPYLIRENTQGRGGFQQTSQTYTSAVTQPVGQRVLVGGRGPGGRGHWGRGRGQQGFRGGRGGLGERVPPTTSNVIGGPTHMPARVFAIMEQDAQASNNVVTGKYALLVSIPHYLNYKNINIEYLLKKSFRAC